jgi:aldose 1-epimerase
LTDVIELRHGALSVQLAPAVGGSIARFCIAQRDVLRCAPTSAADAASALVMGSFPMVPFANRIRNGCFVWQGTTIHIPANIDGNALPIHGVGWLKRWRPIGQYTSTSAQIRLHHEPDQAWPFAFTADQTFTLNTEGLAVQLDVHNSGDQPMPATLGFHPYFPAKPRLQTMTSGIWESDQNCLPVRHLEAASMNQQLASGAGLEQLDVDHTLTGWNGMATLNWPGLRVDLKAASPLSCLHLFTPPSEPFVCLEPVSSPADGLNSPRQPMSLALNQSVSIKMRIEPRLT